MTGVLLAQHGLLLRKALATVMAAEPDLHVVAEAGTQEEAIRYATSWMPDVVVAHHDLPGSLAISELCVQLCTLLPQLAVLIVADSAAAAGLIGALASLGPRLGLVTTEASPKCLVEGIRTMDRGGPVLDVDLAVAALTAPNNPLTERERTVLRQAYGGAPVDAIAAELFLSTGTVRNYLSRAVAKTGARTRIEAIRIALDAGWI